MPNGDTAYATTSSLWALIGRARLSLQVQEHCWVLDGDGGGDDDDDEEDANKNSRWIGYRVGGTGTSLAVGVVKAGKTRA